jgi:hypothetical protein
MTTESDLRSEFDAWLAEHKLRVHYPDDPGESAHTLIDELDYACASSDDALEIGTITLQLRWLRDFLNRWSDIPCA